MVQVELVVVGLGLQGLLHSHRLEGLQNFQK